MLFRDVYRTSLIKQYWFNEKLEIICFCFFLKNSCLFSFSDDDSQNDQEETTDSEKAKISGGKSQNGTEQEPSSRSEG